MSLPVFIHQLEELTTVHEPPSLESVALAADDPAATPPEADFPYTVGHCFTLSGSEARHAVTVKRLEVGEDFILADATGHAVRARITSVDGKSALTATVQAVQPPITRTPRCVVVQAIPKSDRAELAVDLLTQAGVDAIVPWQSERTISRWDRGGASKAIKARAKWVQAAIAATKQSRRSDVPAIPAVISSDDLTQWCTTLTAHGAQVVVLHEAATRSLAEVITARANTSPSSLIVIIVGPEGGISENEQTQLQAAGAQCVLLGPEVYRTAAAGAFALSALGAMTSRWNT